MKHFFRSKFATVIILIATVLLAGVAIFTAYRLFSLRKQAVAPSAPSSEPAAVEASATPQPCTGLAFTIGVETNPPFPNPSYTPSTSPSSSPSTSPSSTASPTDSPTDSPSQPNSCGGTCGSNSNCASGLYCYQGYCKNPSCPTDTDCVCNQAGGPTSTPTPAEPTLPDAGISFPTILGISAGTLLLIISFLLAL